MPCRDTLGIAKLDQSARSLRDAKDIVNELTAKNVKINIGVPVHDPDDPVGRLLFNVVALADVATVGGVERTDGTIKHFSQSNPAGDGQGDVAALLRRVAQTIDDLGDVSIEDVTFTSSVTEGEDDLAMTVYYYPEPRRR
ncbi:hypothetical protein [Curtobacterium sp. ER1/6]|jgi:hypothetical protein|uniref:hypothetical protein n=1 Tax=Curtobacterium sp. ER1/6 TaxID=1891920 RepID=UPI00086E6513|nr:hypothetical protein [Curtobacterium sp. ER1/6]OEI68064.1 hypothetical protein Cus16_2155 [Curtobacterium sp. ER1/6]